MDSKHVSTRKYIGIGIIWSLLSASVFGELTLLRQSDEVHCVTSDATSAVSWIFPTDKQTSPIPQETSHWSYPNASHIMESLNCDLMNSSCFGWTGGSEVKNTDIESSGINLGTLQDYRWNKLKRYQVQPTSQIFGIPLQPLRYSKIATYHVSILAYDDAYIYLSEGNDTSKYPMYWLVLDGWSGTRALIRKCPKGELRQAARNTEEKTKCYDREFNEIPKNLQRRNVLRQGKHWVNFTLQLDRYRAPVRSKEDREGIKIMLSDDIGEVLYWNNKNSAFNITYIFFRNYFYGHKQNFWRFHQYNVMMPIEGVSKISSPAVIISQTQHLCLSVIYFSNALAQLNVRQDGNLMEKRDLEPGIVWQVKRVELEVKPSTLQIEFTFDKNNLFLLGDVRICEANEVFVSSLKSATSYECREIKSNNAVAFKPITKESIETFECLGDTFGDNCSLSCSTVLQSECKDMVVSGQKYSSCLSGFYSPFANYGQFCNYECGKTKFGPNCKYPCGYCLDGSTCDRKTGHCAKGCTEKYRKPLCKEEWPTLNLSYSTVHGQEIQVHPTEDTRALSEVTEVLLQYRKTGEEMWSNATHRFSWPLTSNLSVAGLRGKVEYEVRAILLQDGEGYFGDNIKFVKITTPCVLVDESKISVEINKTMIIIDWPINDESCLAMDYRIQLDEAESLVVDMLPFTISNLTPNTKYNVSISLEKRELLIVKHLKTVDVNNETGVEDPLPLTAIVTPVMLLLIIAIIIVAVLVWKHKQRNRAEDSQKININFADETVTISRTNETIPAAGRSLPIKILSKNQDSEKLLSLPRNNPKLQILPRNDPKAETLPRNHPESLMPSSDNDPSFTPRTVRKTDSKAGAVQKLSCPVHLDDFESYVERCIATKELHNQHALFPRGQTQSWDYGRLPENKMKNRYGNLVAYDATRVKLTPIPGDLHSDYINANYIDGYDQPKAYIASQGPKSNTINDFWKMIWQENVNSIVMLANLVENGKTKCEKYWPDPPQNANYGDVSVQTFSEDVYADYTFRGFHVACGDEKRVAHHFHFTSWPDHGVPHYSQSVTAFLIKILNCETTGPVLVHCSAGVGRTGTIILADMCLKMGEKEDKVDPLGMLQRMRTQRANLVDNASVYLQNQQAVENSILLQLLSTLLILQNALCSEEQFEFVHILLLDYYLADSFNIPCSKFMTEFERLMANNGELLNQQFTKLNYLCNRDILRKRTEPDIIWPEKKSRFPDIAPGNFGRVLINRPTGGNNYINAVYVDGFHTKGQFIATQLPLSDTVPDLWHLVAQTSSSLIVVLNQPNPSIDQTTCKFWPLENTEMLLPDSSSLVLRRRIDSKMFTHLRLQPRINDQAGDDISIVMLNGWEAGAEVPTDTNHLLHLWEEAERLYKGKGPIIVMCHDGARACGLFLASVFVVEKMKLEKEVDVGLAVRTVRLTRPHFIASLEQFEFLHDLAMMYQNSFETYANFQ